MNEVCETGEKRTIDPYPQRQTHVIENPVRRGVPVETENLSMRELGCWVRRRARQYRETGVRRSGERWQPEAFRKREQSRPESRRVSEP